MSIAIEPVTGWPALLCLWQTLDLPDGWKAEIADGGITMTPPPDEGRVSIVDLVHKALVRSGPDEWGIHQTLGLQIAGLDKLYIPDLVVVPLDAPWEHGVRMLSVHALLAVEVTSKSNAMRDRMTKKQAYARGGVEIYVLIDRHADPKPRITVYSEPDTAAGEYQRSVTRPFGETIEIPEPIDLKLDTTRFR